MDWIPENYVIDRVKTGFKMRDMACKERIRTVFGKFDLLKNLPNFIPNLNAEWRRDLLRMVVNWLIDREKFPHGVAREVCLRNEFSKIYVKYSN